MTDSGVEVYWSGFEKRAARPFLFRNRARLGARSGAKHDLTRGDLISSSPCPLPFVIRGLRRAAGFAVAPSGPLQGDSFRRSSQECGHGGSAGRGARR